MTTAPPDSRLLERLIKLLGMCGSAHDGERAVAAAKANQLIRENNLTWHDVIPTHRPQRHNNGVQPDETDWRKMRDLCRKQGIG